MTWWERLWEKIVEDYAKRLDIEWWARVVQHVLDSLLVLLLTFLLIWLVHLIVRRLVARVARVSRPRHRRRFETIAWLVNSILRYVIYITSGLWILGIWGVDTSTLVVGSAVLGAAVGFGSQGLVQDVIVGLSILAEEELSVGDYVEAGGKWGVVEEVGLRVLKLRDHLGVQHVIFNRTIALVSNYGPLGVGAIIDIAVPAPTDADRAQMVALEASRELATELPVFVGHMEALGLIQTGVRESFIRLKVRVLPRQESTIQEQLIPRIKKALALVNLAPPGDQVRVAYVSQRFRDIVLKAQARSEAETAPKLGQPTMLDA